MRSHAGQDAFEVGEMLQVQALLPKGQKTLAVMSVNLTPRLSIPAALRCAVGEVLLDDLWR